MATKKPQNKNKENLTRSTHLTSTPGALNMTSGSKKAVWSSADDMTMMDVLIKQKELGQQSDSSWKATVYGPMVE